MPLLPALKGVRESRLWTQQELADRARVHRVTIAALETGQNAAFSTVRKLAEALGVEPEELMAPRISGHAGQ